jgi:hypothetical protein
VVGEAEVVVGTEVQGLGSVLKGNLRALGRADIAFTLVQAGLLDGFELGLEMIFERAVHDYDY